jgi:hypothetical protein
MRIFEYPKSMKLTIKLSVFFMLIIVFSLLDSCKKNCYHCKEWSSQAQANGRLPRTEDTCDPSRMQYLRNNNYNCDSN